MSQISVDPTGGFSGGSPVYVNDRVAVGSPGGVHEQGGVSFVRRPMPGSYLVPAPTPAPAEAASGSGSLLVRLLLTPAVSPRTRVGFVLLVLQILAFGVALGLFAAAVL